MSCNPPMPPALREVVSMSCNPYVVVPSEGWSVCHVIPLCPLPLGRWSVCHVTPMSLFLQGGGQYDIVTII